MNYIIVDDEPIAHRIIEGYCSELPNLNKIGNAYDAFQASIIVAEHNVDLIFLDLNMPKITGFEWLKTLPHPPKIIVTTAYKEYALDGYELDIVDYLLKPFSLQRFLKAVNKVKASKEVNTVVTHSTTESSNKSFFLKGDKMHHHIQFQDVLFVEAYGNYSKVYLPEKMIVAHEKISSMEIMLAKENFLRIHKSFIVSVDKIEIIQGNQVKIQEHKIPVGQTYKSKVNNLMSGR